MSPDPLSRRWGLGTRLLHGVPAGKLHMREWVELFDEPRPSVIQVSPFARFRVAGLVHSEVEVHTVYQRLFKKLAKAYTPCNTYFLCFYFASFVYWIQA